MSGFTPSVELAEQADAYHLSLELPGVSKDDLDIQVTAEAVSISGERKSQVEAKTDGVTRSEFCQCNLHRSMVNLYSG
ncbi:MAG: Hsp20/alpha crystallin family protein [Cyanobacteria bacterium P01_G01_bin.38]